MPSCHSNSVIKDECVASIAANHTVQTSPTRKHLALPVGRAALPEFTETLSEQGKQLPKFVECEFDELLRCGRLEHGFLRVVCGDCKYEKLVAFSCRRRGFCPSCGARRMTESAALLVDDLLPQ